MLVDKKIVSKIFELKLTLKNNKQKNTLSKFKDTIPMYDIYSEAIYPIKKENIYYRLIECDYRFITNEIKLWITELYRKYPLDKYKNMLLIIENYNLDILKTTSYNTLYEHSSELGGKITICKRESFHYLIKHLRPYYSKIELVKLGQNMNLIKNKLDIQNVMINDDYFKICKKISSNDISFKEINNHTLFIIDYDIISYIAFYSFNGSYLYNKFLRSNKKIDSFLYNGIKKIYNCIAYSPEINNNYFLYRFIWDDMFIKNLKIGDIFTEFGFLSSTRDPFYSPGILGKFGLILIKINIHKNETGIGLLIENFSLFPKEEEFLLLPNSKLKLISKDDNFKYYHTNTQFEKLIGKKYEFELIYDKTPINLIVKDNFKIIDDLKLYELYNNTKVKMFKSFVSESNQIIINLNNKKYLLICSFFDADVNSSYSKLFFNKNKNGLLISIYDNGYPYLSVECGTDLTINYINQFYFYNKKKNELNDELLDLILELGRIFCYSKAIIINNYRNFSEFESNYDNISDNKIFLYTNFYDHTLYDYIKNNNKFLNFPFIKSNIGWYMINDFVDNDIPKEFVHNYKFKTIKETFIDIVENNFTLYPTFVKEIINNNQFYLIYEIYEKLNYQNRIANFKSLVYDNEETLGDDFKLIFRQELRRY
jgi:hypothetical protein